jgi:hypothetical protein
MPFFYRHKILLFVVAERSRFGQLLNDNVKLKKSNKKPKISAPAREGLNNIAGREQATHSPVEKT